MSSVPIPQGAQVGGEAQAPPTAIPVPKEATVGDLKYSEKFNKETGEFNYTFPEGQTALDPRAPGWSKDEQGNVYYKGEKQEVQGGVFIPPVPLPSLATAARVGGTAAGTAVRLARTPVGKFILDKAGAAITAGSLYAGFRMARKWLGL